MAVSKLWPVTSRLDHVINYATNPEKTKRRKTDYSDREFQALKDVLAYAKDEEKTEREFFCEGINCQVANARDSFISVKEQFGKADGIQAYHGYLSFKEQNISPELAQKIGMEFAKEVWGKRFQVVVTTHLNTQHLHCHFVVNSISFVDGKRLQNEEKVWFKFRHTADRICEKYGLYYDPNPNRSNPTAAKTEKSPPSEQSLKPDDTELKKEGAAQKQSERPSVREKLNGFIAQSKQQQEPEHHEPKHLADKSKQPAQTKHQQPKRRKLNYKGKHAQAKHYQKSKPKER